MNRRTIFFVWTLFISLPVSLRAATEASLRCQEALMTWQLGQAKKFCAENLFNSPYEAHSRLLAAEALFELGRFDTARKLLESIDGDATQKGLSKKLAPLGDSASAHRGFIGPRIEAASEITHDMLALESSHFTQHFRDKDEIVATYAVPILERAYSAIKDHLDFDPTGDGEKIHVIWQPEAKDLAKSTGLSTADIETSGTIAVCKFHQLLVLSPAATAFGYDWADTIAHELVHLFVAKKTRDNTPVWLHEGLAKFYQSSWRTKPGMALDKKALDDLKSSAEKSQLISLERMHPSMAKLPSQRAAALAFTEVTTLIADRHRRFGSKKIALLLDALGRGEDLNEALRNHWNSSLQDLFELLKRIARSDEALAALAAPYAADEQPIVLKAPQNKQADAAKDPSLLATNDADVIGASRLAELLELRGHKKAALRFLKRAHKRSKVRDAALNVRLARMLRDDGDDKTALELMRQTRVHHPSLASVNLELGLAAAKLHENVLAKEALLLSMQQNPFDAEAHDALSKSLLALGEREQAQREERFAAMSRQKRRRAEPAQKLSEAASVHVLTHDWGAYLLDQQMVETPLWKHPLAPGTHTISARQSISAPDKPLVHLRVETGETLLVTVPK